MKDRAFVKPVEAMQHLSKLAYLAAVIPKAIQQVTLEHVSLQTAQNTGRKANLQSKICVG
jgi:hypothetical protein